MWSLDRNYAGGAMHYYWMSKRVTGAVVLAVLLIGGLTLGVLGIPQEAMGAPVEPLAVQSDDGEAVLLSAPTPGHHVFMPVIAWDHGPRSFRFGFCSVGGGIARYPEIRGLAAGWYVNFNVNSSPLRPMGIEFVQTVRLRQLTECEDRIRDREECPYVVPHQWVLTSPETGDELVSSVLANPGALWLIGNEMDRHDWGVRDPDNPGEYLVPPGGQDEMLPQVYARAYHDLYHLIKGADPTAKVAIGGVIQPTPARLWYLSTVWETYKAEYDEEMPVDVWNIHNFILQEKCDDYGADIPPGCPESVCDPNADKEPCYGTIGDPEENYDNKHDSAEIFEAQIMAFREWMAERGQRNKPLIVSEYGILYQHGKFDPDREGADLLVRDFMEKTFHWMMTAKHHELGYAADENRLVQRWAWYSLDDTYTGFNRHGALFDRDTLGITPLGQFFGASARQHLDTWGNDAPPYWP